MNDTKIGRELPGGDSGKQSRLPPQLSDELDKVVGAAAAPPAVQVPFVTNEAAAPPGPVPAVADVVPAFSPTKVDTPVPVHENAVAASHTVGSTPVSPEQFNPAPARLSQPTAPMPKQETKMASNFDYNRTTEQFQNAAQNTTQQFQQGLGQATDTMRKQTEDMTRQGQQAMAQMTDRSREAMDKGMKAFEDFNSHARGNADALMAASRAAAQGIEQIVQQTSEFTRKAFEGATSAMRTMATARTATDVMAAQNEFAKAQFDNMVGEFSRMTETMMKVAGQVMEPIQSQVTDAASKATDSVKGMMKTGHNG